jgi:hypothetical protein
MADPGSRGRGRPRVEAWYERWGFPSSVQARRSDPTCRFLAAPPFLHGVNLPWLTYGCDFGANAWRPTGGVSEPAARASLRTHLARQADAGVSLVRWFVFCDGRAGVALAPDGRPAGLDALVPRDIDAALDELRRADLRAIFVLFDFLLAAPGRVEAGVPMGGRQSWIAETEARERLLEHVVRPLAIQCGAGAPVAAWDVLNEPEWLTRGRGRSARTRTVPARCTREFLVAATQCLHDVSRFPVTVGLASAGGLDLVGGADLDVYQVHWYDRHELRHPLSTPVSHFGLDRPVLLGEYPTRGSRRTAADIVDIAQRAGYAGALAWSALARDEASGLV